MRRWRPILSGALQREALAAVAAVADDVAKSGERLRDPSLISGGAGLAVFHAYVRHARLRPGGAPATQHSLQKAVEAVASVTMGPMLFGGFSGVAWAVAHLQGKRQSSDEEGPTEAVDAALVGFVSRPGWKGDFDLVSGLVGLGVYALERLPSHAAISLLESIIDRLEETAVRRPGGLTWHTRPSLIPRQQREVCPSGYDNLGLAHGAPGVIALIGAAYASGIRRRVCRRLLAGAVPWLLRQRLENSPGARFPAWIAGRGKRGRCRSAWCYGDPGVAIALFTAARNAGERGWEREALAIAHEAAQRPPAETGVVDAGLCHGAAGLAQIYNRFFQATGHAAFRGAARFWFERALAMRRPGRAAGGFRIRDVDEKGRETWRAERGLFGAAGIALALLSAATSIEPEWDRVLLLSTAQQ